jgi:phosphinothricin acetyltransferase
MTNDIDIIIRTATVADARALLEIYSYYVENTAISFDCNTPTIDEFSDKITATLQAYPYIVAELGGELIGYAYASPFKERKAYDWSVEATIYIKQGYTKQGYGKMLYMELERLLRKQNILNVNACIAYTDNEDKYLTNNSMHFHERMGYRLVGKFNKCGYKFGTWYDMIWMEKIIGSHTEKAPGIIPFSEFM